MLNELKMTIDIIMIRDVTKWKNIRIRQIQIFNLLFIE